MNRPRNAASRRKGPMGILRSPDETWVEKDLAFQHLVADLQTADVVDEYREIFSLVRMNLMLSGVANIKGRCLDVVAAESVRNLRMQEAEFHWRLESLCRPDGKTESWFENPFVVPKAPCGRGMLLGTLRFGMVRHLALEAFLSGESAYQVVNGAYSSCSRTMFSRINSRYRCSPGHRLDVIDIDSASAGIAIVRALRRGGIVCVALEGTRGSNRSVEVEFLGRQIDVRRGIFELATTAGALVWPVIGIRRGQRSGALHFRQPLHTADGREAIGETFRFFERHILEHPSQWEGVANFHNLLAQQRRDERQIAGELGATEDLVSMVRAGMDVNCLMDRYAVVEGRRRACCVDTASMRAVEIDEGMEAVTKKLVGGTRERHDTRALLQQLKPGQRGRGAIWLAKLLAHGIVARVSAGKRTSFRREKASNERRP